MSGVSFLRFRALMSAPASINTRRICLAKTKDASISSARCVAALGVLHVTLDLRPDPGAGIGARARCGLRGRVCRLHGRGRRRRDARARRPPVARVAHETAEGLSPFAGRAAHRL